MRRISAILLALMLLLLPSCGSSSDDESTIINSDSSSITLWVYPMNGDSQNHYFEDIVDCYTQQNPGITISITYLDEETADSTLRTAVETMQSPDIVLGGSRPLLTEWGASNKLIELSDLYPSNIYDCVKDASKNGQSYNLLPLAMNTYMMAINYELFEDAGALRYLDQETHTWTTDGFINAVAAVRNYTNKSVASVYCGGQNGDYGTRALVTNLYGGSFFNEDHSSYTLNSEEILHALTLLKNTKGIVFDPDIAGPDSTVLFAHENIAMTFCWDYPEAVQAEYEFTPFPMCFPTAYETECRLNGEIIGFSIFDNNNKEKIENSKSFLKYLYDNHDLLEKTIISTGYFPCFSDFSMETYDPLYLEYLQFTQYTYECSDTASDWAVARSDWWQLLRGIASGADIEELLTAFSISLNGLN